MSLPNTQECPQCFSTIDKRSLVCSYCQQRIQGMLCQSCKMICPLGASICHHCHTSFGGVEVDQQLGDIADQTFVTSRLGTLLTNFSLVPTRARITQEKLIVTHYRLFGLISSDEEIPWNKVAGFSHRSGLIWDAISIETRGQSAAWISPLNNEDALALKAILQKLER